MSLLVAFWFMLLPWDQGMLLVLLVYWGILLASKEVKSLSIYYHIISWSVTMWQQLHHILFQDKAFRQEQQKLFWDSRPERQQPGPFDCLISHLPQQMLYAHVVRRFSIKYTGVESESLHTQKLLFRHMQYLMRGQ